MKPYFLSILLPPLQPQIHLIYLTLNLVHNLLPLHHNLLPLHHNLLLLHHHLLPLHHNLLLLYLTHLHLNLIHNLLLLIHPIIHPPNLPFIPSDHPQDSKPFQPNIRNSITFFLNTNIIIPIISTIQISLLTLNISSTPYPLTLNHTTIIKHP